MSDQNKTYCDGLREGKLITLERRMDKDKLKKELKRDEGFRQHPYICTAGKLTIGYGRNLDDVGISEYEAEQLLDNDIEKAFDWLHMQFRWFKDLSDTRQRALCNMLFNLGSFRFLKFKRMLSAFARGDYSLAADEAKDSLWYKQVGKRAKRVVDQIRYG